MSLLCVATSPLPIFLNLFSYFLCSLNATLLILFTSGAKHRCTCDAQMHHRRFPSHLALAKLHLQIPAKQQMTSNVNGYLLSFGCIQHACVLLSSIISNVFDFYQDYTKLINTTDNRVGNGMFCFNPRHSFL